MLASSAARAFTASLLVQRPVAGWGGDAPSVHEVVRDPLWVTARGEGTFAVGTLLTGISLFMVAEQKKEKRRCFGVWVLGCSG